MNLFLIHAMILYILISFIFNNNVLHCFINTKMFYILQISYFIIFEKYLNKITNIYDYRHLFFVIFKTFWRILCEY